MSIEYKGHVIIEHYGLCDTPHYHWGTPDEFGHLPAPMDCTGPAPRAVREMYGRSNLGGCESVEECQAEIDAELTQ